MNLNLRHLLSLKLAVLSLAVFGFSALMDAQEQTKPRVGVVAFDNSSQIKDASFGRGLVDALSAALHRWGKYQVVERTQLAALLGEAKLGMEGITEAGAIELGKLASLDAVVVGNIIGVEESQERKSRDIEEWNKDTKTFRKVGTKVWWESNTNVSLSFKMINVQTGELMLSEQLSGRENTNEKNSPETQQRDIGNYTRIGVYTRLASQALNGYVARAIDAATMGIEGSLAHISTNQKKLTAVIDIGSRAGVRVGHRFRIIREDDPIYNRAGEKVGVNETIVAYFEVQFVTPETATGRIVSRKKELVPNAKGKMKNVEVELQPGFTVRRVPPSEGVGFFGR
ncbi:MAG: hypothetical protein FWG02_08620 [Holophagaceae bacterium]|nr:hypothetical protein [Holophagaceae bacterium]